jgi:hypothetical protein
MNIRKNSENIFGFFDKDRKQSIDEWTNAGNNFTLDLS